MRLFGDEIPVYWQTVCNDFEECFLKDTMVFVNGTFEKTFSIYKNSASDDKFMPEDASQYNCFIIKRLGHSQCHLHFAGQSAALMISEGDASNDKKVKSLLDKIVELDKMSIPVKYNTSFGRTEAIFSESNLGPVNINDKTYKRMVRECPLRIECSSRGIISLIYKDNLIFLTCNKPYKIRHALNEYRAYKVLRMLHDEELLCSISFGAFQKKLLVAASMYNGFPILDVIGVVDYEVENTMEYLLKATKREVLNFFITSECEHTIKDVNGVWLKGYETSGVSLTYQDLVRIIGNTVEVKMGELKTGLTNKIKECISDIEERESKISGIDMSLFPPIFTTSNVQLQEIEDFIKQNSGNAWF